MKIPNAIKQIKRMKIDMPHLGDEYNALMIAIKSLTEWQALLEEAEEMPERDDLQKWIRKHIKRIEA